MNHRNLDLTSHYEKGPGHRLISIASQFPRSNFGFINRGDFYVTSNYEIELKQRSVSVSSHCLYLRTIVPGNNMLHLRFNSPHCRYVSIIIIIEINIYTG